MARAKLVTLVDGLHRQYGDPFLPPTTDPFGLILWEQVGYLANDDRRAEAFEMLRDRVGLTPGQIASAPPAVLEAVARAGGSIAAADRAGRMHRSARAVIEDWDGDLDRALAAPVEKARRVLKRFPMIGLPGTDKILLLTHTHPVLALDSNGLRVLLRVGYGEDAKSYDRTYRNVQDAIAAEIRPDFPWLTRAYGLLRHHGQNHCKQRAPACTTCAVHSICAFPKTTTPDKPMEA